MKLPKIATKKQRKLFEYGLKHPYSILAADPRLGKSATLIWLQQARKANTLIICPSHLVVNWKKEINKWSPESTVTMFRKGSEIYEVFDSDFVIISFDLVQKAEHLFVWADMVGVDECFTGDVEILTEKGFIRFDSLPKNILIAQYSGGGEIDFIEPSRYIEKPYRGEIIDFTSPRGIDVSVTPGHEMLVKTPKGNTVKRAASSLSPGTQTGYFINAGMGVGPDTILTPEERLAIAFQADGSWQYLDKTASFSFSKDRKIKEFENILRAGGFSFTEVGAGKNKKRYLVSVRGINVSKKITDIFSLPLLSKEKCRAIVEEMVKWDGSVISKSTYYYSSVVKDNRDFYQAVSILAGYGTYGSVQKDKRKKTFSDVFRLFITKDKSQRALRSVSKSKRTYRGNVYCVTVPSGNIIVRRNGKALVVGNCHNLKAMATKRTQFIHRALFENSIKYFFGLTGTPLKNRVREFYSLLSLTYYDPRLEKNPPPKFFLDVYPDEITFAEKFSYRSQYEVDVVTKKGQKFRMPVVKYEGLKNVDELKQWLKGRYIRIKAGKDDLPPIVYQDVLISETPDLPLLAAFEAFFDQDGNNSVRPDIKVQAALEKVPFTIKYVEGLMETVECCLIYSDHRESTKKLAAHFNCPAITGEMTGTKRAQLVADFQAGKINMLCATIGSLKEGADLFRAKDLVINDFCWVPGDLKQVINRVRAIGEKEPRSVHRIFGSPQDEKIVEALNNKMAVIEAAT